MTKQEEPQEEPQRKDKGDCLTPSATILVLFVGLAIQLVRWLA